VVGSGRCSRSLSASAQALSADRHMTRAVAMLRGGHREEHLGRGTEPILGWACAVQSESRRLSTFQPRFALLDPDTHPREHEGSRLPRPRFVRNACRGLSPRVRSDCSLLKISLDPGFKKRLCCDGATVERATPPQQLVTTGRCCFPTAICRLRCFLLPKEP
jgi:hypothetical protein